MMVRSPPRYVLGSFEEHQLLRSLGIQMARIIFSTKSGSLRQSDFLNELSFFKTEFRGFKAWQLESRRGSRGMAAGRIFNFSLLLRLRSHLHEESYERVVRRLCLAKKDYDGWRFSNIPILAEDAIGHSRRWLLAMVLLPPQDQALDPLRMTRHHLTLVILILVQQPRHRPSRLRPQEM